MFRRFFTLLLVKNSLNQTLLMSHHRLNAYSTYI